jgi:hypothetical protein
METTTATEKTKAAAKPYSRIIDLGNGVQIPVKNETEARFVTDMIDLARQGRATLPKNNAIQPIPDNTDIPKGLDWWPIYEECRADRF